MMQHTTVQALGQARLAELHRQAQRDGLARAARGTRQHQHGRRAPGFLAAVTRRVRRPAPAQGSL